MPVTVPIAAFSTKTLAQVNKCIYRSQFIDELKLNLHLGLHSLQQKKKKELGSKNMDFAWKKVVSATSEESFYQGWKHMVNTRSIFKIIYCSIF